MPDAPRPFVLTSAVLAEHRSGRALCLSGSALGRSFAFAPSRAALGRLDASPMDPEDDGPPSGPASVPTAPQVALVQIRGPLASEVEAHPCGYVDGYQGENGIVDRCLQTHADPGVGAVVIDVRSPGGDALGCGEAAAQLADLREQSGKPVYVFASEADSAAYWLAAGAASPGCFFLAPSGDAGCVGAWNGHEDLSGALEQEGRKVTLFAYPADKVAGNPFEPLSDVGAARLRDSAEEHGKRFCAAVAELRGLDLDAVVALGGASLRGAAAVEAGLVDGLALSVGEVIALAAASLSAPALSPSPAAPSPAPMPMESESMASSALLPALSAAGLSADLSDAAALSALVPRLALAGAVLEVTGETDPARARGKLEALAASAAELPALRARVEAIDAADKERARLADLAKRREIVEGMVRTGRLTPARAWASDADGAPSPDAGLAPRLAALDTAALSAMAEAVEPLSLPRAEVADEKKAIEQAEDFRLPPAARAAAKTSKNPERFAALYQQLRGAAPRAIEG